MADSFKVKITGLGEIKKNFKAISLKGQSYAHGEVGFSAHYAVHVHEDLTVFHPNGQAKFLEAAYRRSMKKARDAIKAKLIQKKSLLDATYAGALVILKDAQSLVPVDTGYLKNSGYVKVR